MLPFCNERDSVRSDAGAGRENSLTWPERETVTRPLRWYWTEESGSVLICRTCATAV